METVALYITSVEISIIIWLYYDVENYRKSLSHAEVISGKTFLSGFKSLSLLYYYTILLLLLLLLLLL